MNVLPFMEFIATGWNYSTQMKALIEQSHCLPFSAYIDFFFTY